MRNVLHRLLILINPEAVLALGILVATVMLLFLTSYSWHTWHDLPASAEAGARKLLPTRFSPARPPLRDSAARLLPAPTGGPAAN